MLDAAASQTLPDHEHRPFATWALRSLLFAIQAGSLAAVLIGGFLDAETASIGGAVALGATFPLLWLLDGIELRRGVRRKTGSDVPLAARVGLWLVVSLILSVVLVLAGALLGAGFGAAKGADWLASAKKGAGRGLLLAGGVFALGLVTSGSSWLLGRLFPSPPQGPNGRWIRIEARAHAMWHVAVAASAIAATMLAFGRGVGLSSDHVAPPAWLRPAGLVLIAAAAAVALFALRRATRPGALRIEERRAEGPATVDTPDSA